jgi:hypothetical protein
VNAQRRESMTLSVICKTNFFLYIYRKNGVMGLVDGTFCKVVCFIEWYVL